MTGLIYQTEQETLALQAELLGKIVHDPRWVPFVPYQAADGRWCCPIAETVVPFLTAERQSHIVELPEAMP